jgi:hypothetical protein
MAGRDPNQARTGALPCRLCSVGSRNGIRFGGAVWHMRDVVPAGHAILRRLRGVIVLDLPRLRRRHGPYEPLL